MEINEGWTNPMGMYKQQYNLNLDSGLDGFMPSYSSKPQVSPQTTRPNLWTGTTDEKTGIRTDGVIPTALGVFGGLAQSWLGFQQLRQAKKEFAFQKEAWKKNYETQRKLINTEMEGKQRAAYLADPRLATPEEYMTKNGI